MGKNQNPKKSLDQNLTPKKSHVKFPSHNNFQKALKDIIITNLWIDLNAQKNSYLNQAAQKVSYPKKSQNQKFQTQKNPSIIHVTWNPD